MVDDPALYVYACRALPRQEHVGYSELEAPTLLQDVKDCMAAQVRELSAEGVPSMTWVRWHYLVRIL